MTISVHANLTLGVSVKKALAIDKDMGRSITRTVGACTHNIVKSNNLDCFIWFNSTPLSGFDLSVLEYNDKAEFQHVWHRAHVMFTKRKSLIKLYHLEAPCWLEKA
ncbi:unnamed protein product [Colias eurytheme]|nr:unnamed protein product [Colias eurytheme]